MARPREFDVDEALQAAMEAFWRRGYEATSLADLMAAMGLQKGSIYKAFGDKHALFMCVLQRYLDEMLAIHRRLLTEAASPKVAIRGWLDELIAAAPAEGGSCRGCFAMNTLVELGPYDERARTTLEAHFDRLRQLLIEQIRRGQELGELRRDVDPKQFAQLLMTLVGGLLSGLKGAISRSEARELAETTLQLMT
jgi:TetR/AcrR family transcriptional regulator, transcriptional repressor for nem operon